MTPEEYERIKKAEKEHLRAIKRLKEKLRQVERQKTVNRAVRDIAEVPGEDIRATHEEMIDRLAMDAIQQEARLEYVLSEQESSPIDEEEERSELEKSDEELQKLRAQELVRQMKIQMGLDRARRKQESNEDVRDTKQFATKSSSNPEDTAPEDDVNPTQPGSLPDKTIGRMPKK